MAQKVWVVDLDGTVLKDLYREILEKACCLIIETLGDKAPSEREILIRHNQLDRKMFYEINPRTGKPYFCAKNRFPSSLVRIYEILCKEAGIKIDKRIAKKIFKIGIEVFDEKRYLRKIKPAARSLFKFLQAKKGDIILILTRGPKKIQGGKREALRKAGLLKYCDSRYFPDGFIIVENEKGPVFKKIREKYGNNKIYHTVGDTYFDDIAPALAYSYVGIYIPSPFNWKEVGKLQKINQQRNKKNSRRFRDLTEIIRKYDRL